MLSPIFSKVRNFIKRMDNLPKKRRADIFSQQKNNHHNNGLQEAYYKKGYLLNINLQ